MKNIEIISLNWDRIYLNLELSEKINNDIYLVNNKIENKICDEYIRKNIISMPITCAYDDTMVDEGTWHFKYKDNYLKANLSLTRELTDKDKVFFYKKHDYAYIVTFDVDEDFNLMMHINYMKKNKNKLSNKKISSKNTLFNHIAYMCTCIFKFLMKVYYNFLCLFKTRRKNKILFMSETRDRLSGNLLSLSNRMNERNLDKEYKMYYSFKKVLSDRKSALYYFKVLRLMAKVDYIFIDDYAPTFNLIKLRKTKLIQLWHAGVGFKSVGYSRFGKEGSPHPIVSVHRNYDYAVVAAPNLIPTYQEVFGLTRKHFLSPGMLRLDGYLDSEVQKKAKEKITTKYPVIRNKQVVLFAPTYRGVGQKEAYYDFEVLDLDKLYKVCLKNNYIVLFKFHPFIKEKIYIKDNYKNIFIDASDYPDINELFYITDILITDYSSNIYEYSLFEKPIIFFDYDIEKYSILRGVHTDLNNSPGNVCKQFDEVLELLETKRFDIDKVKEFKNINIVKQDSKACDRLINELFNR